MTSIQDLLNVGQSQLDTNRKEQELRERLRLEARENERLEVLNFLVSAMGELGTKVVDGDKLVVERGHTVNVWLCPFGNAQIAVAVAPEMDGRFTLRYTRQSHHLFLVQSDFEMDSNGVIVCRG